MGEKRSTLYEENVGSKHLCDQPHTAAVNVTELAFAAECRAAAALLLLSAGPTAANPPHAAAAVSSWERQTDRQTGTVPLRRPCRIV